MEISEEGLTELWENLGKEGAFQSEYGLRRTLKRKGYAIPSNKRLRDFFNKMTVSPDRRRSKALPSHLSTRRTIVTRRNYIWHCDSAYYRAKGFKGPWQYFILCVDAFSKKFFARPVVKLTADSTTKAFLAIINEDNENIFPENLFTDRGSEYQKQFAAMLREHKVDHIMSKPQQKNKAYFAERGIRSLKLILSRIAKVYRGEMFHTVLKGALNSYNTTVSRTHNMTPQEAHEPKNQGKVMEELEGAWSGREQIDLTSHEKLNRGDKVRVRLPYQPFEKETDPKYYPGIYEISEIIHSYPLPSYRVVAYSSEAAENHLPGTFQYKHLRRWQPY